MSNKTKVLEFESVSFAYRSDSSFVLKDFSLAVEQSSFSGIIGPSGCGKSTLLKLAAGLLHPPTEGCVRVLGQDSEAARKKRLISFLPQQASLLPWRNVTENVALPGDIVGDEKEKSRAKASSLLDLVGLGKEGNRKVYELSVGMQQRVNIARSLMSSPSLLLLDEPFVSLDELVKHDLMLILQEVVQILGLTTLFVSHSLEEAVQLSDDVYVLEPIPTRVYSRVQVSLERPRTFELRTNQVFCSALARARECLGRAARGGKT